MNYFHKFFGVFFGLLIISNCAIFAEGQSLADELFGSSDDPPCGGTFEVWVHKDCRTCDNLKICTPGDIPLDSPELGKDGGICDGVTKVGKCVIRLKVVYLDKDWKHPETGEKSPCKQGDNHVVPCALKGGKCDNGTGIEKDTPADLPTIVKFCCEHCKGTGCVCGCDIWKTSPQNNNSYGCFKIEDYNPRTVNVEALPECECSKVCLLDSNVCNNPPTKECVELKCVKNESTGKVTCMEEPRCKGTARDGVTKCCDVNKDACATAPECNPGLPEVCQGTEVCVEPGVCYSENCDKDKEKCCPLEKCRHHPACKEDPKISCDNPKLTPEERLRYGCAEV